MMPERTCVGCQTQKSQRELLRFRRRSDGEVVPCRNARKRSGRSAYLCATILCFKRATKRGAMSAALGRKRSIYWAPSTAWEGARVELNAEITRFGGSGLRSLSSDSVAQRDANARLVEQFAAATVSDLPSTRRDT